jgi:hypothetical protein
MWFDVLIIVVVGVAFVGVVGYEIYKKVTGKSSGCDCGCSDCGGRSCSCSRCNHAPKRNTQKKQ